MRHPNAATCVAAAPTTASGSNVPTFAAGYDDGVVRVYSVTQERFVLKQAVKTHNCSVKQVAFSGSNKLFAVLGADDTIFFLEVLDMTPPGFVEEDTMLKPLGFVKLPGSATSFVFNEKSERVLVGFADGKIVEYEKPDAEAIDTTETYQFALPHRSFQPALQSAADEAGAPSTPTSPRATSAHPDSPPGSPGAKSAKSIAISQKSAKEEADEEGEEQEEGEKVGSGVCAVMYTGEEDKVLFAGTNKFSGHLYEICLAGEFSETGAAPETVVCHPQSAIPAVVSYLDASLSDNFMLVGFENGHAWVCSLDSPEHHLEIALADCKHAISGLALSDCDSLLHVSSKDGSVFSVQINKDGVARWIADSSEQVTDMAALSADSDWRKKLFAKTAGSLVEARQMDRYADATCPVILNDIDDPQAYSIQDAKLKAEEAHAQEAAEKQKKRVRQRVVSA